MKMKTLYIKTGGGSNKAVLRGKFIVLRINIRKEKRSQVRQLGFNFKKAIKQKTREN